MISALGKTRTCDTRFRKCCFSEASATLEKANKHGLLDNARMTLCIPNYRMNQAPEESHLPDITPCLPTESSWITDEVGSLEAVAGRPWSTFGAVATGRGS